jgi:hypothetical protein
VASVCTLSPLTPSPRYYPSSVRLRGASSRYVPGTVSAALAVGRAEPQEPRAVRRPLRMLFSGSRLPGHTPTAPPPERLEFESAAGCGRKGRNSARHGESRPQSAVPGSTAACALGAETRLHRPRAARDRATLPGAAGTGGHGGGLRARGPEGVGHSTCRSGAQADFHSFWLHLGIGLLLLPQPEIPVFALTVLLGDPESQGDPATTRAPDPVRSLGAHLRCQPVSGRGADRGKGGPWPLARNLESEAQIILRLPIFSPVALAQCLNLPVSPSVKWVIALPQGRDYEN